MRDPGAGAHGSLAVSERIPGQGEARVYVAIFRIDRRGAGKPGVTGIKKTRRRVGDGFARNALIEVTQVERVRVCLRERHAKERIPGKPVVQGQLRSELPGVLHIQRHRVLACVDWIRIGLAELSSEAQEEVREAVSR